MGQRAVDDSAPDFEAANLQGQRRKLGGVLEKGPAILVFYKASCPTCQFTFPLIQRIYQERIKGSGAQLLAISQDDIGETNEFSQRLGLEFEILLDEYPYTISREYGVEFVPALFRIESNGRISLSEFGFTKAGLNAIAGEEFLKADDGLPATRPG
jgi:peroxiredoxin